MSTFSDKEVDGILDNFFSDVKVPEIKSKEQVWKELNEKIDDSTTPTTTIMPMWTKVAAAAMIVMVSTFVVFWYGNETIEASDLAGVAYTLPDGSKVSLNSNTTIAYNSILWGFNRSIDLEGEAFFEVVKGKKFTVETGLGEVQVLGTKFNVNESEEGLYVSCYSGKVKVSNTTESSVVLTKGERVNVEPDLKTLNKTTFNSNQQVANWKSGNFSYRNETLSAVIRDIESFYHVSIVLDSNIQAKKYTGNFTKVSLEEAMKIICLPLNLNYQFKEDKKRIEIGE